jgi:hypothetical protein
MGDFLVTQPSLAQRAICRLIFSPKLPILVINLLMALVSLLLVCLGANQCSLASNFVLALAMARLAYSEHVLVLIFKA